MNFKLFSSGCNDKKKKIQAPLEEMLDKKRKTFFPSQYFHFTKREME